MPLTKAKLLKIIFICIGMLGLASMFGLWLAYLNLSRELPPVILLKDVQFQQPLRIYSSDGKLITEFGEKRRIPVAIDNVPAGIKNAFIAAEDDRFLEHPGVDYMGLTRAVINQLMTGDRSQGGSTITMQVARNFFLSAEKSYKRKISEILLALRIEQELSKDQILELYLNKIYLGKRAYGIAAAAQVYYGKNINELTLPQVAMIAGLPKAPSRFNPVANPTRAILRRNYVLRRMLELEMITQEEHDLALQTPLTAGIYEVSAEAEAPFVAEMVRAELVARFGEDIYTSGIRVYTTIDSRLQAAANQALRNGLLDYDQRHGYRGPIKRIELPETVKEIVLTPPILEETIEESISAEELFEIEGDVSEVEAQGLIKRSVVAEQFIEQPSFSEAEIDKVFAEIGWFANAQPALVTRIFADESQPPQTDPNKPAKPQQAAQIYLGKGEYGQIGFEQVKWARRYISTEEQGPEPEQLTDVLRVGDYVWVSMREDKWNLMQLPQVEGALVSLDPQTGAIVALSGGFDFFRSKFNRVIQAKRQPGSSFKPFIYAAALNKGYTAASIINDAPVVFDDPALEGKWRPENYSGKFYGPTRLREGLVKSRNLVSIRLLIELGIGPARRFVRKFGFGDEALPKDLSLALGSGMATPMEMARGFAVFGNEGFLLNPYFIDRVEDANGNALWLPDYTLACLQCFIEAQDPALLAEQYEIELPPAEGEPSAAADSAMITAEPVTTEDTVAADALAVVPPAPAEELAEDESEGVEGLQSENVIMADPSVVMKRRIRQAEQVVDPEIVYLMNSMLRDVIQRGTGVRARVLGRDDIGGKTGTTNEQHDAWFSGFNYKYVTTTWIGFDSHKPLGMQEAGASSALPIWIDYMQVALENVPEQLPPQPDGIITMRIDAETGLLAGRNTEEAIFEMFRADTAPTEESGLTTRVNPFMGGSGDNESNEPDESESSELF